MLTTKLCLLICWKVYMLESEVADPAGLWRLEDMNKNASQRNLMVRPTVSLGLWHTEGSVYRMMYRNGYWDCENDMKHANIFYSSISNFSELMR